MPSGSKNSIDTGVLTYISNLLEKSLWRSYTNNKGQKYNKRKGCFRGANLDLANHNYYETLRNIYIWIKQVLGIYTRHCKDNTKGSS